MNVRYKESPSRVSFSGTFNTHGIGEVIVEGEIGRDSVFVKDLDVQLPDGSWKDMDQAFTDKDIVPDNLNVRFAPPVNAECKARGYNP